MRKSSIIEVLGERALLLPQRLADALAANDRLKYYFSLLQAGAARAADPQGPSPPELRAEREAAGVPDAALDAAVAGSAAVPGGGLRMPGLEHVAAAIAGDLEVMLAPIVLAAPPAEADELRARLARLLAALPSIAADTASAGYVAAVTRARHGAGDSLHLLVMDLHRRLNALQAAFAAETVDGARAYGIEPADRPLVAAFMRGLNATAPLKFDHPGLETTATRVGDALVIQNDIGTTDAHVLVLRVSALATSLTYTDVHRERARFFRRLFAQFAVDWRETGAAADGRLPDAAEGYVTLVGVYVAGEAAELERYLAFLASRIVFLIDWNKARKRLRSFLRKRDCLAVLAWAAEHGHGHRAFLSVGGERLVYELLEAAGQAPLRYGQRLDEALGRETAVAFMQFVLKTAAEGLLAGRSHRLIRDEVRAELIGLLQSVSEGVLELAAEHAMLVTEIAAGVRDALLAAEAAQFEQAAHRARRWESAADALVSRAREAAVRAPDAAAWAGLLARADDAADGLEEAAWLLTLLPGVSGGAAAREPLGQLAELVVAAAREYMKLIEVTRVVERGGAREDTQDFLEAIDALVTLEHRTDDAERALLSALLGEAGGDGRAALLYARLAQALEETADCLSRSALWLRDRFLGGGLAT